MPLIKKPTTALCKKHREIAKEQLLQWVYSRAHQEINRLYPLLPQQLQQVVGLIRDDKGRNDFSDCVPVPGSNVGGEHAVNRGILYFCYVHRSEDLDRAKSSFFAMMVYVHKVMSPPFRLDRSRLEWAENEASVALQREFKEARQRTNLQWGALHGDCPGCWHDLQQASRQDYRPPQPIAEDHYAT